MDQATMRPLIGSYHADDCQFLLKPLTPRFVDIAHKESLIQRQACHYSALLSREQPPPPAYLALFRTLTKRYRRRLASEVLALAERLASTRPAPLTIVSLARAGTPFGVLLRRALTDRFGVSCAHYSLSIVRDRGIDGNALRYLLRVARRPPAGLVFVDAWTAKGVIAAELKTAIAAWNHSQPETLDPSLCVIVDLAGCADLAATHDDYAIPSGMLNATVSGLVSRSILNAEIGPDDFHGCVLYDDDAFRACDQSRWFVARIAAELHQAPIASLPPPEATAARRALVADWVARQIGGSAERNLIKPGIAEATRALLRRMPRLLLLRDAALPDVRHLCHLAERAGVATRIADDMPFNAVAWIAPRA